MDLAGYSPTVYGLSSTGSYGAVTNSGGTNSVLTVNQSGTALYSGQIADGATSKVALVKQGNGLLTLNGADNYSGGTTVYAGTLQLGFPDTGALGKGGLTVNGGMVDLQGNSLSPANGTALPSLAGTGGTISDSSTAAGTTLLSVSGASGATTFSGAIQNGPSGPRDRVPQVRREQPDARRKQQLQRRHERQWRRAGLRRQQRPANFRHGERQWRRAEHVEL